ncbi:DUF397 domain-containing protein [Streptomyces beigongshangae]|uniref:DUF397 domain-containing protein n=1 Tax=Streptomyces beigongshangae TaxID=2841597 RepID=UPI001C8440CC|nr:DUF397 domain-containing protein [Streptomyces sp. REN17]
MRTAPGPGTSTWRRSSHSGGTANECVEVRDGLPGLVPVRDSKDPARGVLVFGAAAWSSFVTATAAATATATATAGQ